MILSENCNFILLRFSSGKSTCNSTFTIIIDKSLQKDNFLPEDWK